MRGMAVTLSILLLPAIIFFVLRFKYCRALAVDRVLQVSHCDYLRQLQALGRTTTMTNLLGVLLLTIMLTAVLKSNIQYSKKDDGNPNPICPNGKICKPC